MYTVTVSSKNQITLPKYLLQMLAVNHGDKLLISGEAKNITLSPIKTSIADELVGSIKISKTKKGIPLEEVRQVMAKKVTHDIVHS